ncbi:MAG: CotH kinase family protein [Alistipes sp.]|nr:CotH kinase family protein [Alistipes sp.]
MRKIQLLISLFVIATLTVAPLTLVSCGDKDSEVITPTPEPKPEPQPKPNDKNEGNGNESEPEPSDSNFNIAKIIFSPEDNPSLDTNVVIYPDANNTFSRRMYANKYINGKTYLMPVDIHNLVVKFESDAKAIYVNGIEHQDGAAYDFRQPLTITAKADTGNEKGYTIALTHYTELPIMFINLASGDEVKSRDEYEDATIEIWGCGDLPGLEKMSMQIHGRGNSSWDTFKKKPSYTISLESKQKLLGMPKHKKWVLIGNYRDKTLLRNNVAWWISDKLSGIKYTPRFQHVELILNGTHRGVYQLVEQVRIDNDRVDINEMKPTDTEGEAITGGYIIELDRGYDSDQWVWTLPHLQGYSPRASIKKPKIDESNEHQRAYIRNYLMTVDSLLGTSTDMSYVMERYIDMPSWAAQWLVFELSGTPEPNGPNSWYTYKDKSDDKWYCGPPWDFDYTSYIPSTANLWRNRDYVYQPQMRRYAPYREELIRQWEQISGLLPDLITYINEQRSYMRHSANANWNMHEQNLIDDNRRENGDEFIPSDEAIDRMIDYLQQKWAFVESNIRNLE